MSFEDIPGTPVVRVSTGAFEALKDFVTTEFPSDGEVKLEKERIGDLALAVGVREGRTEEREDTTPTTAFNLHGLDKHGVIKPLIEERHPDADPSELRDHLQEYLEGGVQMVAEEIDDTGVWDYHQYVDGD